MTVTPLSRPPEQDELWALIEEARRRARRRRRRYGIAFVLVCLGGAGVYALLARGAGRPASVIGAARGATGPPSTASGPVWYTRTVRSMHESLPAGGITLNRRGFTRRHGPEVRFDLRVSEETWERVDGTIRDRTVAAAVRFRSRADRAKWRAYGRPLPNFNNVWLGWISHDGIDVAGGTFPPQPGYRAGEWLGPYGRDVADSLFTYPQLLALPSGPVALRARLTDAETALARRQALGGPPAPVRPPPAVFELMDVGSLLAAPIPTSLRRALFDAVITMPGALVNRHAHDALGRPGIAVSASSGAAFQRLIFDPARGALLENAPSVAVIAQGPVGSVYSLPKGVSPVHAAGTPPQPQVPTVSPTAGHRATVFTVTLSPSRPHRPRRPPALDWLLIGTSGPRCFATFAPQLPPLTATGSITHHGRLSYTYRLTPADMHRRTWCPGRYQLILVPADPRQPNAAYLGMVRNLGSSITFQVK